MERVMTKLIVYIVTVIVSALSIDVTGIGAYADSNYVPPIAGEIAAASIVDIEKSSVTSLTFGAKWASFTYEANLGWNGSDINSYGRVRTRWYL